MYYSHDFKVNLQQYNILRSAQAEINKRIEEYKIIIKNSRYCDAQTWKSVNEEKVKQLTYEIMGLIEAHILIGKMITGDKNVN
jgi:hypothetical protein